MSVNTLLGAPRQLVCQCCGMPMNEDSVISRETDGSFNEDYCRWCYANGKPIGRETEINPTGRRMAIVTWFVWNCLRVTPME